MDLNSNRMSEDNTQKQNREDEISLKELILKIKEIWKYLLSKWKIIVPIGLLGGALGLVYSIVKDPVYTANLSFAVIEKDSKAGGLAALAGQFGMSMGGSENIFSGENMLELLKSRHLTEKTLLSKVNINGKSCRLVEYYMELIPEEEKEEEVNPITFPLGQARSNFSRAQDSLLHELNTDIVEQNLSVAKVKKDVNIINVGFNNKDELFAKLFVEILVQEVSDFYIETKTRTTRSNLHSMEARADSLKKIYEDALIGRAISADRNFNPARQITAVEQQKYQTQIQMMGTAYAELVKNIEILKLDLIRETPLVQIIDTPIMPLENNKWGKAKGLILGGFLAGFLIVCYLLAAYFYRQIMSESAA
jgi:primosomal protein N''